MATKTTINISPKVLTGTLTGLGLAAVGGVAAALTPDTFGFLGVWAPGAFAVATILIGQAAAWLKREHDDATTEQATVPVAPELSAVATPPVAAPTVPPLVPQPFDSLVSQTNADDQAAHPTTPTA